MKPVGSEKKNLCTPFFVLHTMYSTVCEIAFKLFRKIYFSTLTFLNEVCRTIRTNWRKYRCLRHVKMYLHKKREAILNGAPCEPPALLCNKRNFNVNDLNWSGCRYGKLIQHSETGSREQKIAIDSNNSFGINKIPQIEQVQAL